MQSAKKENIIDAIKIALVVGTILSFINQYDVMLSGNIDKKDVMRVVLNYIVPFSVASVSRILYIRKQERRRL